MPAALAFTAISLPTCAASAMPLPLAFSSTVEAAATVLAAPSSMTCAYRWLRLRNTARRGRSEVPLTFTRTRRCRLVRPSFRSVRLIMRLSLHPCRPFRPCAESSRLGTSRPCPCKAPVGAARGCLRHLADGLLGDAGHRELGLVLH